MSLSARRAWIEIFITVIRTPIGCVALRKESVDRNKALPGLLIGSINVALRKESVDRNQMQPNIRPIGVCRSPQGERG